MQIAICDDEESVRKILEEKIKQYNPNGETVSYSSGEQLLLAENPPDILFLDIQMPQKNGMEIARELRKKSEKMILIFVTAIEEYVFKAFDVGAFHYLVKPFSEEKFGEVIKRAIKQYEENNVDIQASESCIWVKTRGTSTKVWIKDIIYAEVFNRKIILHKTDGDLEYYGKMSELEKQVGKAFFRSHRSYLIHFKYVEKYNATTIYLERGTAIMAKQNYPEFVKRYLKYNESKRKGI